MTIHSAPAPIRSLLVFSCFLLLLSVFFLWNPPVHAEEKEPGADSFASVSGKATLPTAKDKTLGMAAFFNINNGPPPYPGRDHRVPDHIAMIEGDATFKTRILAGRYYIGIIDRPDSRIPGPPRQGENTYVAHDDSGAPRIFTFEAGKDLDVGLLTGKVPNTPFPDSTPYFTITGMIKDETGKPITESVIIAFKVGGDKRRRPDYTLENSDTNGRYSMKLAAGDSYSILVRTTYGGGQPTPGEYVGRYGGDNPIPVTGKEGAVVPNIDITVFILPEPGIKTDDFPDKPAGSFPSRAPRGKYMP